VIERGGHKFVAENLDTGARISSLNDYLAQKVPGSHPWVVNDVPQFGPSPYSSSEIAERAINMVCLGHLWPNKTTRLIAIQLMVWNKPLIGILDLLLIRCLEQYIFNFDHIILHKFIIILTILKAAQLLPE
jgi:hypothetical protein